MERIFPQDFATERPPERIIGLECEYSAQKTNIYELIDDEVIDRIGLNSFHGFVNNGSLIYHDVGQLEYATPESLGPKDAVVSDFAGIEVVRRLAMASLVSYEGIYRQTGSFMPSSDPREENSTRGYHENYQVPAYAVEHPHFNRLVPSFLASKLWDGQGTLRSDGYSLKQKIWSNGGNPITHHVNRRLSSYKKPMLMIIDNDGTVDDGWRRVELRCVDGGQAPEARITALGATSLMFRLFEQPEFLNQQSDLLKNSVLESPVRSAKIFARDLSFKHKVALQEGRAGTASSVQEAFLDACEELSEKIELPEDELYALSKWRNIIDRQRQSDLHNGEFAGLDKITDNVAFYAYLFKKYPDSSDINVFNLKAMRACQLWDRIQPIGGAYNWWKKHPSPLIDSESVKERICKPPATRAARRTDHIYRGSASEIDWDRKVHFTDEVESFGDAY